jgi:uncharacterized repeat protein (TIGR04138 family)
MTETPDLERLAAALGIYPVEAFVLLGEGLRHASGKLGRDRAQGAGRHLTAQELVDGVLDLAAERWGLMAIPLLRRWRLERGDDLGRITFHLIEHGVLGKQPCDRIEDFAGAPDFAAALRERVRQRLGHGEAS